VPHLERAYPTRRQSRAVEPPIFRFKARFALASVATVCESVDCIRGERTMAESPLESLGLWILLMLLIMVPLVLE
jgi:hypothetical protein